MRGQPADETDRYLASADAAWESLAGGTSGNEPAPPSQALGFGFAYGYYTGTLAFIQAFNEVGGDLSDNHSALRAALSGITLDAPYGPLTLDENRQAIVDTFVAQLVLDEESGEVVQETVAIVPGVDQTFGGTYSSETDPPERDNTPCEEKSLPWQGNEIPVVDGVPQR